MIYCLLAQITECDKGALKYLKDGRPALVIGQTNFCSEFWTYLFHFICLESYFTFTLVENVIIFQLTFTFFGDMGVQVTYNWTNLYKRCETVFERLDILYKRCYQLTCNLSHDQLFLFQEKEKKKKKSCFDDVKHLLLRLLVCQVLVCCRPSNCTPII